MPLTDRRLSAFAKCAHCHAFLDFTTGRYGQTIEQCPTKGCINAIPHPPTPDTVEPPCETKAWDTAERFKRRKAKR